MRAAPRWTHGAARAGSLLIALLRRGVSALCRGGKGRREEELANAATMLPGIVMSAAQLRSGREGPPRLCALAYIACCLCSVRYHCLIWLHPDRHAAIREAFRLDAASQHAAALVHVWQAPARREKMALLMALGWAAHLLPPGALASAAARTAALHGTSAACILEASGHAKDALCWWAASFACFAAGKAGVLGAHPAFHLLGHVAVWRVWQARCAPAHVNRPKAHRKQ